MARGRGGRGRGQPIQSANQPGPSRGNGRGRGRGGGRGRGRGQPSNSFSGADDLDAGSMFPSNRNAFPSFKGESDVMVLEFEDQHLLNFPAARKQKGQDNQTPVGRGRGAPPPEEFMGHTYMPTYFPNRGRGRGLEANLLLRGRGIPGNIGRGASLRGHGFPPPRGAARGAANAGRGTRRGSGLGFGANAPRPDPYLTYGEFGRPLLRPVKFVKAEQKLFEREEEILEAALVKTADDMEDPDMNPVAEQVAKLFAGEEDDAEGEGDSSDSEGESEEEEGAASLVENVTSIQASTIQSTSRKMEIVEESVGFFIDTQPGPVNDTVSALEPVTILGEKTAPNLPLADEEDEIIVFVPPTRLPSHNQPPPPSETVTAPPIVAFESLSLDFNRDTAASAVLNLPEINALHPKLRPRARKIAKRERRKARRKEKREGYGSLKPAAPRTDGSDIEWGSDGPPLEVPEDEAESDDHGMQVEDGLDFATYAKTLLGIVDRQNQNPTTIDDLEIEAKIRKEDEEAQDEDDEDDWDDEEEDEESDSEESSDASPTKGFQTRLEKIRGKAKADDFMDDDDGVDRYAYPWASADEIQRILDENADIFMGRDRKQKRMLLDAITSSTAVRVNKKKGDHIPANLKAQWEKDRQTKSERKRERALARIEGTLGIGAKKNKKGKNKADGPTSVAKLEPILRAFLRNLSQDEITLPSLDKATRIKVHLVANCFRLKSKSLGSSKKKDKTMILTKTTKTGLSVDERRLAAILEVDRDGGVVPAHLQRWGKGRSIKVHPLRQRDGEIIGKRAEKIGDDNIGYQLLKNMGWSEGARIGQSGKGLIDPLIAVIKNTKLGLGATR